MNFAMGMACLYILRAAVRSDAVLVRTDVALDQSNGTQQYKIVASTCWIRYHDTRKDVFALVTQWDIPGK